MRAALILSVLALGACSLTPHQRVRASLIEAGVPDRVADCMAGRMVKRLSVQQLLELRGLSRSPGADGRFSAVEFARRLTELDDPEVITVTGKAAFTCALRG